MRHLRPLLATCVFAAGCAGEAARSPTSPTMGALAQTQAQVTPAEPQSAALTPQAQSGAQLPFRGSYHQTETFEPQSPTTVLITFKSEGTATHLGRYTTAGSHLVDLTTGTAGGPGIMVAANGDQLFSTGSGQATPTGVPGELSIADTSTITGGTGRFEGATGSFSGVRVLNTATGISSGSFTGTITLAH
jgi:hypothetical protein